MIIAALDSRFVTFAGFAAIAAAALAWEVLSTLRLKSMTVQRTIRWAMGSRVVRLMPALSGHHLVGPTAELDSILHG